MNGGNQVSRDVCKQPKCAPSAERVFLFEGSSCWTHHCSSFECDTLCPSMWVLGVYCTPVIDGLGSTAEQRRLSLQLGTRVKVSMSQWRRSADKTLKRILFYCFVLINKREKKLQTSEVSCRTCDSDACREMCEQHAEWTCGLDTAFKIHNAIIHN